MNTAAQYYIFLDVDGVLHPADWKVPGLTAEQVQNMSFDEYEYHARTLGLHAVVNGPTFSCLSNFEKAVYPHLDHIKIVISSSWRHTDDAYEEVLVAMSEDVRARVAGPTPQDTNRVTEINRWLQEYGDSDARAIVIDDDDTQHWYQLDNRGILLLTVTESGFIEKDAEGLAYLLSLDKDNFDVLRTRLPILCRGATLTQHILKLNDK